MTSSASKTLMSAFIPNDNTPRRQPQHLRWTAGHLFDGLFESERAGLAIPVRQDEGRPTSIHDLRYVRAGVAKTRVDKNDFVSTSARPCLLKHMPVKQRAAEFPWIAQ